MLKEIIILGDIEMGGGTNTDDFISDKALSRLIYSLCNKNIPVDLVLNGDTFDFLKCPHIIDGKATYPRHITSEISLAKLRLIYRAHTRVFEALKRFAAEKKNRLFFIVGNHDPDLVHPKVQEEIRVLLDSCDNIIFSFYYNEHHVHAEHGHQYDFLNKVNEQRLFLNYKGQRILSIPWIAFGITSKFMYLKEKYPFLERIVPKPAIFSHHKAAAKIIHKKAIEYFLKSMIYYPIRYYYDPTYTFPREFLKEFYRRIKNVHWDVDEIIHVFKRKRRKKMHRNRLYVLGHVHKHYVEEKYGISIIHPDTWRDEYFMDDRTKELMPKTKRYVQVIVHDNYNLQWKLVICPVNRSTFHFDDVVSDEKKHVGLAAAEEGYGLKI
ncbi:MAG: metallophosphoesterase [Nanoarchaeota archaeon]